jgi:hypothetical protein
MPTVSDPLDDSFKNGILIETHCRRKWAWSCVGTGRQLRVLMIEILPVIVSCVKTDA